MTKKQKRKQKRARCRARLVEKAMRKVWDSLESHFPFASDDAISLNEGEHPRFQKQCIKEYAQLISTLSKLY